MSGGVRYPPREVFICHRCDNPQCCNPDHLFAGTAGDNMRDCLVKGRHTQHEATHCKNGHLRIDENLYRYKRKGHILDVCKPCHAARVAIYKNKLKASRAAI